VTSAQAASETSAGRTAKPRLVFFTSSTSGRCRRVEGFLAQVLQRRRNHGTFRLVVVDERERPDILRRFEVEDVPTLVVVQGRRVEARLAKPRGCRQIEGFLAPWLR
jgi:thioredoxin-like negative regulator of GroEL